MGKWVKIDQVNNFEGMKVRLKESRVKEEYRKDIHITGIATGGFGCRKSATGNAVFINFEDGEKSRWSRYDLDAVWVEDENENNS